MFSKAPKEDESIRNNTINYKRVFSTPEGKEVLLDLMDRNYFMNPTQGDLIKEGRRCALLDILHYCHVDIKQVDEMLRSLKGE